MSKDVKKARRAVLVPLAPDQVVSFAYLREDAIVGIADDGEYCYVQMYGIPNEQSVHVAKPAAELAYELGWEVIDADPDETEDA